MLTARDNATFHSCSKHTMTQIKKARVGGSRAENEDERIPKSNWSSPFYISVESFLGYPFVLHPHHVTHPPEPSQSDTLG
jgi:hypothetical protein